MYRNRLLMIGWITLMSSAFVSLAVATDAASGPQIIGKPADVVYPFVAEVSGSDVYVRSGRGPGYYHCGKVNTGDKVTVAEEAAGWAKILPLPENYSWIHKNYVKVDPKTPKVGTVTGDNVRVWAGSDFIEPIRSSSLQTRLNTGEVVELMDTAGAETGDYYKIKSPAGAFLWVSSEFLKYVGPVKPAEPEPAAPAAPKADEKPMTLEERLGVTPQAGAAADAAAATSADAAAAVAPVTAEAPKPEEAKPAEPAKPATPAKESEYLQICRDLTEKVGAELKKPAPEQNYKAYREQLAPMVDDPEGGKGSTYAKLLLERIDRYELAIDVTAAMHQQDEQLGKLREQIENARKQQIAAIRVSEDVPTFTGTVKPSYIYTGIGGQRRFLLTDDAGRIVCYLVPAGPEIEGQLQQSLTQRISIRGTILSDPKAIVLTVSASQIVPNP